MKQLKHLKTPINENKYVEKILGASILGASILGAYSLGGSIWAHGFGIWASIRGLRLKYEGGLQSGGSIVRATGYGLDSSTTTH